MENNFLKWVNINTKRKENLLQSGHSCPGIYAIAYSNVNLHGYDFGYIKDIIYFGMSISKRGLQGRLYQFFSTIEDNKNQHSGAKRIRYELNKDDSNWKEKIYISLMPFIYCSVKYLSPENLVYMGDIVKQEYVCLSKYFDKFNKLPRFNNNYIFKSRIL